MTFLELTAPLRPLPPQPLGHRLALMKAEDIPLDYYRYLYRAVGGRWLWVERLAFSDPELAAAIRRPGVEIYVLYGSGCPAGYYEIDLGGGETADLVYFGLTEPWIGRGIGPWLLGTALSECLAHGAVRIRVNTCTLDHPAALQLYQRLGFRPVAQEERQIRVADDVRLPDHIAAGSPP